ncbi:MAG: chitobiase/beta-hexosaminidase C-terminal domain-containing protein [Bacteroidales bacterium]|jgi:hypothetical protein|nr:chitobiase/beta-hexosaminidase C-terminal domain-containing protein [Bacteroidales bacterium]
MKKIRLLNKIMMVVVAVLLTTMAFSQEAIIYSTGFDASEGFTAGTVYNNDEVVFFGTTGSQWGTYHGTASTQSAIAGGQSMQMRYYVTYTSGIDHRGHIGYTYTNFDMANVTKVTFKAKNTVVGGGGLNVTASYSIDGGSTWIGDSTFVLTTSIASHSYLISSTGEFAAVRIRFLVALQTVVPTNTVNLYIDDVAVYGIAGTPPSIVATPVITPATGTFTAPIHVSIASTTEGASIYYTLDDSEPTELSTAYTAPFEIAANTTVKAKAWKTNYTASATATAVYTFEAPSLDEVIYTTGFEPTEEFEQNGTALVYNNDDVYLSGPENAQWGTIHGTPSPTNKINGVQSMQMRYYAGSGTHQGHLGYTYTDFDLHNVTKVSFKARINAAGLALKARYSADGGNTFVGDTTFYVTNTTDVQLFTYNITNDGSLYNVRIRFDVVVTGIPTGTPQITLDDIAVYGITGITPPSIVETPVITPATGTFYTTPVSVSIACETEDAVIHYTIDGSEPAESATVYTTPFDVLATCTVKVKAWKTDFTPSNIATATYTFPTEVANIAAFKAANSATNATPYKITGDVIFVYRNGRNIYIQDATGGLLIYDFTAPVITETYLEGDVISGGVVGTCTIYNGLYEMIPLTNTAASTVHNGTVTPLIATVAQINANAANYESRLVKIKNVVFEAGSFNTTSTTNVLFSQEGSEPFICRNNFRTLDMTIAAGFQADVTGFIAIFNTDNQIYPRNNDDIEGVEVVLPVVATPVINPATGTFTAPINVTISCDTVGATIYYTLDGNEPTELSTAYTASFEIAANTTVKAKAWKTDYTASATATAVYTFEEPSNDEIVYTTGFEASEGFVASTVYNNDAVIFSGAEGSQWGTVHGTPTTTASAVISGLQSLQMRYYTSGDHSGHLGYTYTDFDMHNVTRVSFKAKVSVVGIALKASYSTDGGNTFVGDSIIYPTTNALTYTYHITDDGSFYNVRIKFDVIINSSLSGTPTVSLDDVAVYGITGLTPPDLVATPVITPATSTYFTTPISVSIACATTGATIRYTTDGSEPTESATIYTAPFNVSTSSTIKAKAWKTDFLPSNIATATYTFLVTVANIAAFKAANTATNSTPYKITGDVTFVYRNGRNMYIQDATGGLLIYDFTAPVITETYLEGDVISGGVVGTCTIYNGLYEMLPLANTAASTVHNGTVAPIVATVAQITGNYANYESRLVKIEDVIFDAGEFTTTTTTNITFEQDGNPFICRNSFRTLEMTIEAGFNADVTGFIAVFNTDYQIFPRTNNDISAIVSETVPMPYFSIEGAEFFDQDSVCIGGCVISDIEILCTLPNVKIYYTIDGSEPSILSSLYSEPIPGDLVSPVSYVTAHLKAIAVKENMINSQVSTLNVTNCVDGITELDQNSISIYPNPVTEGFLMIKNDDICQFNHITITDITGRIISNEQKTIMGGDMTVLDVSTYKSGIYFITIQGKEKVSTLKFIIK